MTRFRRRLPLQSATLRYAEDAVGLGETSENSGPFVDFCLRKVGINASAPWCAAFVNAMAEVAAAFRNERSPLEQVPLQGLVQSYATHGLDHGWRVSPEDGLAPGDIVCFSTGRTDRDYDHIGLVRPQRPDTPDGHFRTIEGNTAPDVTAGSARDRDGEVVAGKTRSFTEMDPLFLAWGRSP